MKKINKTQLNRLINESINLILEKGFDMSQIEMLNFPRKKKKSSNATPSYEAQNVQYAKNIIAQIEKKLAPIYRLSAFGEKVLYDKLGEEGRLFKTIKNGNKSLYKIIKNVEEATKISEQIKKCRRMYAIQGLVPDLSYRLDDAITAAREFVKAFSDSHISDILSGSPVFDGNNKGLHFILIKLNPIFFNQAMFFNAFEKLSKGNLNITPEDLGQARRGRKKGTKNTPKDNSEQSSMETNNPMEPTKPIKSIKDWMEQEKEKEAERRAKSDERWKKFMSNPENFKRPESNYGNDNPLLEKIISESIKKILKNIVLF